MNYESMTLDELKDYAKSIGIKFGKIGREKLLARIHEKEAMDSVMSDDDLEATPAPEYIAPDESKSVLESINNAIDELDDSVAEDAETFVDDLPIDTMIPVKSITYGGLTYKSRATNAVFRWNQIGAIQYMTVAELNEMNNHKPAFLNKPRVILLDERAIRKFRLGSLYENVAKINNLKKVFASDMSVIESTIDNALRVNMRDILISKVRQMIKNKILVDINIIRLLESKLQFDLQSDI